MPPDQDLAKDLKSKLKLAKSSPLSFALVLGKKPEKTVLLMDKRKKPEVLLKEARKQPDVDRAKACSGEVSSEGSKLFLRCEDDPPAGLVKKLKAFLKANKVEMKPVVLTADGKEFETEPEDVTGGAPDGVPSGAAPQDDTSEEADPAEAAGSLSERLDKLVDRTDCLPETEAARIQAGLRGAFLEIKAGEFDAAVERLDRLERTVSDLQREVSTSPHQDSGPGGDAEPEEEWLAASATLAGRVQDAVDRNAGDTRKIQAMWAYAEQKASENDFGSAWKAASTLDGLLDDASAAEPSHPTEALTRPLRLQDASLQASAPKGGDDSKAALTKEFADLKPQILSLIGVAPPEEQTALQKLIQDFGKEIRLGGGGGARHTLDAIRVRMTEVAEGRVERRQVRSSRLAKAQERVNALREQLARIASNAEKV